MRNYIRTVDDVFDDAFKNFFAPVAYENKSKAMMRTDIKEDDNNYIMEIEMPGFDKEDIGIELNNGYVTISAEKKENDENKKYLRRERYVSFSRSYYVGDNLSEEDFNAKYEKGILELTFPKQKEIKETTKRILIS